MGNIEMYQTVGAEAEYFLFCTLSGIAAAFLYDLLRVSRRLGKTADAVVNAEDIAFLAVTALILFYASYMKNSGELRIYGLFGMAAGIFLYIYIVRNKILNACVYIAVFIKRIFKICLKILFFPFMIIRRILKKPVQVVVWHTGKGVKGVKSRIKTKKLRMKIKLKNVKEILIKK